MTKRGIYNIGDELHRLFHKKCKEDDITSSQWIRKQIKEYVKYNEYLERKENNDEVSK